VINTRRKDEKIMKATPRQLNVGFVLCPNHFLPSQFMNPKLRNRLISSAIPTLFDVPNPPPPPGDDLSRPLPKKHVVEGKNSHPLKPFLYLYVCLLLCS
jgi:hypothetical protein